MVSVLMVHAIVILDLEVQIVQLHHVHLNVHSMDHALMEDVIVDQDGMEMTVPSELVQIHAQDMVFVEIIHVNVILVLVVLIVVNYFAQMHAQTKEHVITELVIVKVHSEEQIVQSELVQMIVHMLVHVLMEFVIVIQDLKEMIVQLKFVQMVVQVTVIVQVITSHANVNLDGLDLIVH